MKNQHETVSDAACGCGSNDPPGRFCVNTEGTEHRWDRPQITTEEIARLGGWNPDQGVIEVHDDGTERTLKPGEVVQLRPGHAFCRRVRWKRGLTRGERIAAEVALLRTSYPDLEQRGDWIRLPSLQLPQGWTPNPSDVAFLISDVFPGAPPYGIFVPSGLRFNGAAPGNYNDRAATQPPFGGVWGVFSWTVTDAADWRPTASVEHGVNLRQWVGGFHQRFGEGV